MFSGWSVVIRRSPPAAVTPKVVRAGAWVLPFAES